MRAVLAVLLTLAVAGCSQKTTADAHLKDAGAELKAAGQDLATLDALWDTVKAEEKA